MTATSEGQLTAQPRLARSAFAVAGVTGAVLVALSGGYGYHRDELYFLAAGAHPAWGYPDQPPLTPLLAWATTRLLGDSLIALRLPSALAMAVVVVVVLAVGPRAALRSPWLWVGVAVALVLWAPNLWWQATHGWPLRELSSSIAAGGSATSAPRWLFLPFQLVLVGLALVPVWGIGLWRLLRDPQLRTFRLFAVSYLLLAALFLVTGGKPYYLAGLYPVLLAAGAQPVLDWAQRGAVARSAWTGRHWTSCSSA